MSWCLYIPLPSNIMIAHGGCRNLEVPTNHYEDPFCVPLADTKRGVFLLFYLEQPQCGSRVFLKSWVYYSELTQLEYRIKILSVLLCFVQPHKTKGRKVEKATAMAWPWRLLLVDPIPQWHSYDRNIENNTDILGIFRRVYRCRSHGRNPSTWVDVLVVLLPWSFLIFVVACCCLFYCSSCYLYLIKPHELLALLVYRRRLLLLLLLLWLLSILLVIVWSMTCSCCWLLLSFCCCCCVFATVDVSWRHLPWFCPKSGPGAFWTILPRSETKILSGIFGFVYMDEILLRLTSRVVSWRHLPQKIKIPDAGLGLL